MTSDYQSGAERWLAADDLVDKIRERDRTSDRAYVLSEKAAVALLERALAADPAVNSNPFLGGALPVSDVAEQVRSVALLVCAQWAENGFPQAQLIAKDIDEGFAKRDTLFPLPADPASSGGAEREDERRSGHSKLVYDKAKRTIVAVDPIPADPARSEGADDPNYKKAFVQALKELAKRREIIAARDAEIATLRAALEWYEGNARLCRLIHSGGDAGRHALSEDGGKRARDVLTAPQGEPNPPHGPR